MAKRWSISSAASFSIVAAAVAAAAASAYGPWPGTAAQGAGALALTASRCALHSRLLRSGFINPVILVGTDCTCGGARQDDGRGWYKGRAGTAAYWCPQMISRERTGERHAYGLEADWWSLGCLVFALMTGRSPFSSGGGTAADNALTLEGRVSFSRSAVFSPAAKDFISKLCTADACKRLGGGAEGWRAVMSHPFFREIDWDLLAERVLPSPSVPAYKIALDWTTVPEKIEGQFHGVAGEYLNSASGSEVTRGALCTLAFTLTLTLTPTPADEQRAIEDAAREAAEKINLTAEDEAVFRACCFASPDWLTRALLKTAAAGEALPPLGPGPW